MLQKLRKWCKGKKGFTIVEIMVLVAIIGIIAAIIIPSYQSYKKKKEAKWAMKDLESNKAAIAQKYNQKKHPQGPEPEPPTVPDKRSGELRKL